MSSHTRLEVWCIHYLPCYNNSWFCIPTTVSLHYWCCVANNCNSSSLVSEGDQDPTVQQSVNSKRKKVNNGWRSKFEASLRLSFHIRQTLPITGHACCKYVLPEEQLPIPSHGDQLSDTCLDEAKTSYEWLVTCRSIIYLSVMRPSPGWWEGLRTRPNNMHSIVQSHLSENKSGQWTAK